MEEDESDTSSGSEMGVIVSYELEGQLSSAQLTSEKYTKDEEDQTSGDRANAGKQHFREGAPGRNRCYPHAIFVIMRSVGSGVKIKKKIGTHPSTNISTYAPHARSISLTRKKTWLP